MREVMDRLRAVVGGEPTHTEVMKHLDAHGVKVDLSSISCWMGGTRRMSSHWLRRIGPLAGYTDEEVEALTGSRGGEIRLPEGAGLLLRRIKAAMGDTSVRNYARQLTRGGVRVVHASLYRWLTGNRPVPPEMALPLARYLGITGDDLWQVFAETHRPPMSVAAARQLPAGGRATPGDYTVEGRVIDGWERYRPWLEVLPVEAAPVAGAPLEPARSVHRW